MVQLAERALTGRPGRVNSETGVITGVRILGLESKNRRSYSPVALRRAVGLYENKRVFLDHGRSGATTPRSYKDQIAVLRNVTFVERKGLYGDLHVNLGHPHSKQLLWDSQHNPSGVGLSHQAVGKVTRRDGAAVVEEIESVESVDLVTDPATTSGLFEGFRPSPREFANQLLREEGGTAADMADSPKDVPASPMGKLRDEVQELLDAAGSADDLLSGLQALLDRHRKDSADKGPPEDETATAAESVSTREFVRGLKRV